VVHVLEVLGDRARADVEGAGYRVVGAALGCQFQHLQLTVGEAVEVGGHCRLQCGTGRMPPAGAVHGVVQRPGEHAEHRPVSLGEIPPGPVQRNPGEHAVAGWQREGNLVLDPDRPEKLGVDAEPAELLLADHIADLDRLVVAGFADVSDQRVLGHMRSERRHVGQFDPSGRVFPDPYLPGGGTEPDLVVDNDVTADKPGQPGQNQVIGLGRVVDVGEAVHELCGPTQHVKRDIHAHDPPGCQRPLSAQSTYRRFRILLV
jgi:hypothetical protein